MDVDKLHTVVVTPGFPKHTNDTTCLPFLQDLVKGLQPLFHVTVIAEDHPVQADYEWNGIKVYTLRKSTSSFGKVSARFKLSATLNEIHRHRKIDIVHVFWLNWAAVQANQWCRKSAIKMVLTFAGREPDLPSIWIKRFHAFRATTVAVSNYHKEHLLQRGFCIDEVIEWSVPKQGGNPVRDIDFAWCGSMIAVKQPEWFIEIIADLKKRGWKGKAVMMGEDPTDRYKSEIISRGWQKQVVVTGLIPLSEVFAWMQRTKVFVHTAAYEAYGRVMAEAIANGCKVVATPVGLAHDHPYIHIGATTVQLSQACWNQLLAASPAQPAVQEDLPEQRYAMLYKGFF